MGKVCGSALVSYAGMELEAFSKTQSIVCVCDMAAMCGCTAEWQAVEPRVRKTFLPIFWVEEKSQATPDQCSAFKKQVGHTFQTPVS